MEIFTKTEVKLRKKEIIQKIQDGSIFIHPTDTIYGIGCNAENEKSVKRIREIKERKDNPFSVWVPNSEWIRKNCLLNTESNEWLQKLPGPYTLVLTLKNKNAVAESVNLNKKSLGVRYPDHWFSKILEEAGIPIVTTSVNKATRPFMTDLRNLDKDIETRVEFIIFEGEKESRPSRIVNLVEGGVKER